MMLLASVYTQDLNPVHSVLFSTILAAAPVIVLFWLLVPARWLAPKAGLGGALAAIAIAVFFFRMPFEMACASFVYGALFGLLPIGWTVLNAMLLYNITVETGQFNNIRKSISDLSGDARIQAILIGFSFGAFLEGAAGGGTPVAICGAIMVGLGFNPFLAAVLCLIANTSPVAYGGLGIPLLTLSGVTNIDGYTLSVMAGYQLPLLSCIVPVWMVRCMCSWRETFEVWPVLVVAGGSFAVFQFLCAVSPYWTMTDIAGGVFSLVVTAIFLRYWQPKNPIRFTPPAAMVESAPAHATPASNDPHAAEAAALLGNAPTSASPNDGNPLTAGQVILAWTPFALMSVFLMLTGMVRLKEPSNSAQVASKPHVMIGPLQSNYIVPIPFLHEQVKRAAELRQIQVTDKQSWYGKLPDSAKNSIDENLLGGEQAGTKIRTREFRTKELFLTELLNALGQTEYDAHEQAIWDSVFADNEKRALEKAEFNFAWFTAPGTAVLVAALVSMVILRMSLAQIGRVLGRTMVQMKVPIPTIAVMLGLSYVTKYAGMDATLGVAFAGTGFMYPFFAAILGWLGVFLTGTDAGSNALFGSLQKITATVLHGNGTFDSSGLTLEQSQVLICTANSTGGVMGKMIDAQSICVATAATHQIGKEPDIFKAVVWHSIVLASLVGLIVLLQAYVAPFTAMVPKP